MRFARTWVIVQVAVVTCADGCVPAQQMDVPFWDAVERGGQPTFYAPPTQRYQLSAPSVNGTAYYPVPNGAVTRATCLKWLEGNGMLDHVWQPRLGDSGSTLLLPALEGQLTNKNNLAFALQAANVLSGWWQSTKGEWAYPQDAALDERRNLHPELGKGEWPPPVMKRWPNKRN